MIGVLGLKGRGIGRRDGMILIAVTTADTNNPYYLAFPLQGDTSGKNHDFAVV